MSGAADFAPHFAVVGSGPAGCYTAQALRKDWPDAEITVLDRLPVPYGLIRYGVAADHQGTKAVSRQFDRLFERSGVVFAGKVEVGVDVKLDALRAHHDAVVLATGITNDRRLNVPGEALAGVYGAGQLTRLINGHPDEKSLTTALGDRVVVVGAGNVALDLVRLLAKRPEDFDGTDLDVTAHDVIHSQPARSITVVARGGIDKAKFDPAMVKELAALDGVRFSIAATASTADDPVRRDTRVAGPPLRAALQYLLANQAGGGRVSVQFDFGWRLVEVAGDDRVREIVLARSDDDSVMRRRQVDTVITAIGFEGPAPLVPSDAKPDPDGRLAPGLYCVGWARRGARGTISDARVDARTVAAAVTADLRAADAGTRCQGHEPAVLRSSWQPIDFAAWQRIDRHERVSAHAARIRTKIRDHAELMRVARTTSTSTQGEST